MQLQSAGIIDGDERAFAADPITGVPVLNDLFALRHAAEGLFVSMSADHYIQFVSKGQLQGADRDIFGQSEPFGVKAVHHSGQVSLARVDLLDRKEQTREELAEKFIF